MNRNDVKNIAVVLAGIDEEYQNNIISGINEYTKKTGINTSYFSAFGGVLESRRYDIGEYSIYSLINLEKFDGFILMTNTICDTDEKDEIICRVRESGKPAVVFDCSEYPDFYNISINNTAAMSSVVSHIINRHNAKVINYISGPLSNPEALERYNAFVSVMVEHGLPVDEKRIFFGEFRPQDGRQAIEEFLDSESELPDAFICANDAMAITAVAALEKAGYRIPDDVIVTGFDYTESARNLSPSITSVKRPLSEAGYKACEIIIDALNGGNPPKKFSLDAAPVFLESCGCSHDDYGESESYKKKNFRLIDRLQSNIQLLNRLTAGLAETETTEEIISVIGRFIDELECEKFCLCLCPEWNGTSGTSVSQTVNSCGKHFSDIMSAPLIWDKGECRHSKSFSCSEMFPEPLRNSGNISFFLPLHFRESCLGYCIITNSEFPIKSLLCHTLLLNISNSIENIRKLTRLNTAVNELNNLYVIDPLCNIYNRNGFIKLADDMYKSCSEKKCKVMVAFIDMDGLKYINDNYGHNEGDFAIQRLANIIRDCCDNHSICARFGGDEFIIFSADADENKAEALRIAFETKLAEINEIIRKPYKISASLGSHVTEAGDDTTLYGIISTADERMYETKKQKKNSRSGNLN